MTPEIQEYVDLIRANLSEDLLSASQRRFLPRDPRPTAGHCYIAVEALWHLAGGRRLGWRTVAMRLPDGNTHWWIRTAEGDVLDPTQHQFDKPPDYSQGVARGLLTREPSRRCRMLLDRIEAVLARRARASH